MVRIAVYCFVFYNYCFWNVAGQDTGLSLRRNKRFVAFPDDASLSVAFCMTDQTIIPAGNIFTQGVNWGISYLLPNKTTYADNLKEKAHLVKRRERRDLYENIQLIIENLGFSGKACIMRALCEAPRKMDFENKSITEKIIETLFRYPLDPVENHEPDQHRHYHSAAILGQDSNSNCEAFNKLCPLPLIDILLGVLNGKFAT